LIINIKILYDFNVKNKKRYEDGVLKVFIPRKAKVKSKKREIK
jgi:HSP20 family molecular chaperone IbpA